MAWMTHQNSVDIEQDFLPDHYERLLLAHDFNQLESLQFTDPVNIIALPRRFGLTVAFNSLAQKMYDKANADMNMFADVPCEYQVLNLHINNAKGILDTLSLNTSETLVAHIMKHDFSFCDQYTENAILRLEKPVWLEPDINNWHNDVIHKETLGSTVNIDNITPPRTRYACAYNVGGTLFLRNEDTKMIPGGEFFEQTDFSQPYQFGCNTILKFEWIKENNTENKFFVHSRLNTQQSKDIRMYLHTF